MSDARSEALEWLATFEAACRGQDFAAGRRLFAPDAVAFGTYATAVHGLDNIELRVGRFQDTLPAALAEGPLGYAFVDGHHDEEATLEYFERLLPHAPEAVLVFDDIRWNDRMERAWRRIAADDRVGLAVDLDEYGVVFTGGAERRSRRWWRLGRGG